jgi:hypothetical protein
MSRTVFDCARVPGNTCSVQMIGDRDDVLAAAKQHLVAAHDHEDNEQLHNDVSHVVDDHQQVKTYASWGS